ncbi:MAG TPA: TIGR03915 family putative DNA repair protein [Pyrinomonadaceae bacterium]|nr:TIGR03915 family putative DNA repair protein [Pyrinomonadaceae bacterium]
MINVFFDNTFTGWRDAARDLLRSGTSPDDVIWMTGKQGSLFAPTTSAGQSGQGPRVPSAFFALAELAACFDDATRWDLLYRILVRLVSENRNLLSIESDPDVRRLQLMAKAVKRDIHKFHAFVRFRRTEIEGKEIFVAWHEPHHFTVEVATPFFARRFGSMNFSILTPKGCAHWDRDSLIFSDAVEKGAGPLADEFEDFWLMYYRSIFNPFRLKTKAMKKELPVRHWPTLPEAVLIPELIREAGGEPMHPR